MNSTEHSHALEEVMAYLDGELDASTAQRVRDRIASCDQCAEVSAALQEASRRMAEWSVGPAPTRATVLPGRWSWAELARPYRYGALATAALVVLAVGLATLERTGRDSGPERPASIVALGGPTEKLAEAAAPAADERRLTPRAVAEAEHAQPIGVGPLMLRTAQITIVPKDFDLAREELGRRVTAAGGFIGQSVISGAPGEQRTLTATLRVPGARLDETLAALRALGTVTQESQDADDVTQQSVDLDARLRNARASEERLKAILEQRTGRLSDVLDVEREIARVRGDIERMEAERKSLDGRIAYASVSVRIVEERKAAVNLGPLPLPARFRNAFVDGWATVFTALVELGLVLTALTPALLLLIVLAAPAVAIYRRRRIVEGGLR